MPKTALTDDHQELYDGPTARRYFAKFERITAHLLHVVGEVEAEGPLTRTEARILGRYLTALSATFRALSYKYLMTGRSKGSASLTFDRHESGFPVAQELMMMALDAAQVQKHLGGMASTAELKDRMVRQILRDLTVPVQLQFALAQRLYYETLALAVDQAGGLFWPKNDPDVQFIRALPARRHFLLHWAVYDTQANLPVIYLMDVEDSGKKPLPQDDRRWPMVQAHLMAQSGMGLKLLTIAQGFDKDFSGLHPKRLRRMTLGPMYSHDFTLQSGPISQVLSDAKAADGEDWALVWTVEDLLSEREEAVKEGWFSSSERQVFTLDAFAPDSGLSRMDRMVILPERPYQVLSELNQPGLRDLRKFVVGASGQILPAR